MAAVSGSYSALMSCSTCWHWLYFHGVFGFTSANKTSCTRAAATICLRPGQQVMRRYKSCTHMDSWPLLCVHVGLPVQPTKAAWGLRLIAWWPWPLTYWPWKWYPSHVWRGLPLCQFWSSYASLFSILARCTRQTDRQTSDKSIA